MTTAARPTFHPAQGGHTGRDLNFPTQIKSSKQLPSHTKLKLRQKGQHSLLEIQERDLKTELEQAEREYRQQKKASFSPMPALLERETTIRSKSPLTLLEQPGGDGASSPEEEEEEEKEDIEESDGEEGEVFEAAESEEEDSDEDESEEEDETDMLMRELEKIKKERAQEKEKKEQLQQQLEEEQFQATLLSGNPLLAAPTDLRIKRRWDEDVVFKNQAKMESKPTKRFINDTIRSDFHRKFLSKYIK